MHGFRMPVFFLLSGFFTAMLWRRRGLPSLIRHRLRRVALPLALAMATVGPAMEWVVARALGSEAEGFSVRGLVPRLGEFHHLWFLWMLLWLLAVSWWWRSSPIGSAPRLRAATTPRSRRGRDG